MSINNTNHATSLEHRLQQSLFEVHVAKESFKFNAAHFVAFDGFRERLHGHNYQVSVRLFGSRSIGSDGYLIDFGDIKEVVKRICKNLNEHFLCPTLSDVMNIVVDDKAVTLTCQDGAFFSFPKSDCFMLPIVHATTEELSIYLYEQILIELGSDRLRGRGIHTMETNVAEAPGQSSSFRFPIPAESETFDIRNFIPNGQVNPRPCLENCSCISQLSSQLERLAEAINNGKLKNQGHVTVEDLKASMENDTEDQ
mmetsp:Transcript_22758/g.33605  ORF Transcript_22758/g.33605 Transcript_22758/m.33605 type:complete len:254 (+) Transcript_22758:86-847(+)|eukprot:CAMPEP_0194215564 /NCGR_PEP_ID=MMETSP0156-20130528/17473_1 /TAXON_ID=33649 /ORGANISM="Thalassionema nitzschioides, Strain L26-B" /LENGTH=253 /DNA_ID=CAMNT_0038944113 /DNA_START=12 /DNA_END=773 /DNA_ORIENTATION=+